VETDGRQQADHAAWDVRRHDGEVVVLRDFGIVRLRVDASAYSDQITSFDKALKLYARHTLALQPPGSSQRMVAKEFGEG
jgi:hypothetical protein